MMISNQEQNHQTPSSIQLSDDQGSQVTNNPNSFVREDDAES